MLTEEQNQLLPGNTQWFGQLKHETQVPAAGDPLAVGG